MLFVGLTGGIASGKSEALAACERLGAAVLSSDAVVHELLDTDEVRSVLSERWGSSVLSDGAIDRGAVAQIVFERPEELAWLERTLFPMVGERIAAWRAGVERSEPVPGVAVVEVPLLFEAGIEGAFDATIAVVADEQVRATRAAGREHEAVKGRAARQLGQEEKAGRADYVVRNDGTLEDLERELEKVLDEIERGAGR